MASDEDSSEGELSLKRSIKRLATIPLQPRIFLSSVDIARSAGMLPRRSPVQIPPREILAVILTDFLGDSVMSLPFIEELHRAFPQASIDVVVGEKTAGLLNKIPNLRKVYSLRLPSKSFPAVGSIKRVAAMASWTRSLGRTHTYDLAVLPRWGNDPSLSHYLAAITGTQVWGHAAGDDPASTSSAWNTDELLTCISHGGAGLPEAVRQLRLLKSCGAIPELDALQMEKRAIASLKSIAASIDRDKLLQDLRLDKRTEIAVFSPGASHPARRWPPERFAELAKSTPGYPLQFFSIGAPADIALGERIEEASNGLVRNLCGKTTLDETIAILSGAKFFVGNDSGPAHIAGGLGIPTFVLSACPATSTTEHVNSPRRVRPVGPHVKVLQPAYPAQSCGERCTASSPHCILGLEVEEVAASVSSVL